MYDLRLFYHINDSQRLHSDLWFVCKVDILVVLVAILVVFVAMLEDKRLISSALKHFGHNKLSAAANSLDYGKPKKKKVRKPKSGDH